MVSLISARQSAPKIVEQVPLSLLVDLTSDELSCVTAMTHPVYGVPGSERFNNGLRLCKYQFSLFFFFFFIGKLCTTYDVFNPRVCHVKLLLAG